MARFPPRRSYRVGSAMTSSSRRPSLTDTMMNHRTCLTITSTDLSVRKKPHVDPSVPVSPGPRPPVNRARFDADVAGIASLSEPTRRALYLYVQAQASPVSRDEAAAGVGVPRHTAKFHLDKLVADGLLESEYRRRSGRQGPGAGGPAQLYPPGARELAVMLPDRRYDLARQLLAPPITQTPSHRPPLPEPL